MLLMLASIGYLQVLARQLSFGEHWPSPVYTTEVLIQYREMHYEDAKTPERWKARSSSL